MLAGIASGLERRPRDRGFGGERFPVGETPALSSREKFGSNPSFIHFSVNLIPSVRPTIMTPGPADSRALRAEDRLSSQRNGQGADEKADAIAVKRTKKVETIVKLAPGLRYAWAT
jgi:hypothetical protein